MVDFDPLADGAAEALVELLLADVVLDASAESLCDPEHAVARSKVAAAAPVRPSRATPESLLERFRSCIEPATILALRLTADSPESIPRQLLALAST